MKITKYGQSCVLLEEGGARVLIDPGTIATPGHALEEFLPLDAVLYTHQHADHLDQEWAAAIKSAGIKIITNRDVMSVIGDDGVETIADGGSTKVGELTIEAYDLPHFPIGGGEPQNTGYVINGHLFHPGDSAEELDITVPNVALTIGGSYDDFLDRASNLALKIGAKKVVPIHYEGSFKPDPDEFKSKYGGRGYEIIVLTSGQSTEL